MIHPPYQPVASMLLTKCCRVRSGAVCNVLSIAKGGAADAVAVPWAALLASSSAAASHLVHAHVIPQLAAVCRHVLRPQLRRRAPRRVPLVCASVSKSWSRSPLWANMVQVRCRTPRASQGSVAAGRGSLNHQIPRRSCRRGRRSQPRRRTPYTSTEQLSCHLRMHGTMNVQLQ